MLIEHRHDVVLESILYIGLVVASLNGIALNPSLEHDLFVRIDEDFEVQLLQNFLHVKNKYALHNDDGCRLGDDHLRFGLCIVKTVFGSFDRFSISKCLDITGEGVLIDRLGYIEVFDAVFVNELFVDRTVIVVLRNDGGVVSTEGFQQPLKDERFTRRATARDADDERFFHASEDQPFTQDFQCLAQNWLGHYLFFVH